MALQSQTERITTAWSQQESAFWTRPVSCPRLVVAYLPLPTLPKRPQLYFLKPQQTLF